MYVRISYNRTAYYQLFHKTNMTKNCGIYILVHIYVYMHSSSVFINLTFQACQDSKNDTCYVLGSLQNYKNKKYLCTETHNRLKLLTCIKLLLSLSILHLNPTREGKNLTWKENLTREALYIRTYVHS